MIPDASQMDWRDALAALAWQIELGADEPMGDVPVNRFEAPAPVPQGAPAAAAVPERGAGGAGASEAPRPEVSLPADGGAGDIAAACGQLKSDSVKKRASEARREAAV